MDRIFSLILLSTVAFGAQNLANAQSEQPSGSSPTLKTEDAPTEALTLPAAPRGKSTVMGGEIKSVDPVLDQITLKAYGERPIKIFFDERTQVFRDGNKINLTDLGPAEHASVQTVLDGTTVFALSVHILSKSPEGDYQGRVISFNSGTGELAMSGVLSNQPMKIHVASNTSITRQGQSAFASAPSGQSDLVPGALISVKFESKQGKGVASQIAVLATPGATFVFSGNITSFDMHSGLLVLVDPRDEKTYTINFDPARFPISQKFHSGLHLRVAANFGGNRYTASEITETQAAE
jgi:hypothetical protein